MAEGPDNQENTSTPKLPLVDQATKIVDDYVANHPLLRNKLAEGEFKPVDLDYAELHTRIGRFLEDEEDEIPVKIDDPKIAEIFQLREQVIEKLLRGDEEIRVLESENTSNVIITRRIDADDLIVEFCLDYGGPYHGQLQIYCQEPVTTAHDEVKYEISDIMSVTQDSISAEHYDLTQPDSLPKEALNISLKDPSENFTPQTADQSLNLINKTLNLYLQS
jgi:hypothetical protein